MTHTEQSQGAVPSPSHGSVVGRHGLCHCKAVFGLDDNMAQAWLTGRAVSTREGCSKPEPKGGEGESVASGLVSGWAITATGFDAEAATNSSHFQSTGLPFQSQTTSVPTCKPLAGVCPRSELRISDILAAPGEGSVYQQ